MEPNYSLEAFCNNIRQLRIDSGLTQPEMAQRLMVSVQTLHLLETGLVPADVNYQILIRIYQEFGIFPHDILSPH